MTAAPEYLSAGTTQLLDPGIDNSALRVAAIGFDCWHAGVLGTQFNANANGAMRPGGNAIRGGAHSRRSLRVSAQRMRRSAVEPRRISEAQPNAAA